MSSLRIRPFAAFVVLAGLACGGGGGDGGGPDPVSLSGTIRDYFTGTGLAGVLLAGGGQTGTTTSDGTGAYTFSSVPANSSLQITASLANYRDTRNAAVAVGTVAATADLAIVSTADLARQYTGLGVTQAAGQAAFFVDLVDDGGQPREGIPLADITLVDTNGDPVGTGPFAFGAGGDLVDPTAVSVTTAFGGRSRIGYLNVPPGRTTLRIEISTPAPEILSLPLSGSADGVTLGER